MSRAALLLSSLLFASQAHAADALTVEVASRDGCPGEGWFRDQLARRGLRGSVRADIGADAQGYAADIEARTEAGAAVKRRLTGASCATVAEGLLVVAEVHLAGLSSPPPAPEVRPQPPPSPPPAAPQPAARAPLARFALGALAAADTAVTGDLAFGGGLTAWVSFGAYRLRGLALSGVYSRADVLKIVPVTHEHLRARIDVIPFDIALGPSTTVGFSVFLSGGSLHAAADVEPSTPGARALWLTGLGARLRHSFGPVFVEPGVDATLALTRRRFEVAGVGAPLFSLPLFGVAAALAVGVPLGR